MLIMKIALVVLVFCAGVGLCVTYPSEDEFNLFCRILAWADGILLKPEFAYEKEKDNEVVKEMTVLYNATTDNMKDFRTTLWNTKVFFEAHPPPTDAGNRKKAHNEIGKLIAEGQRKIKESQRLAKKVNEKIDEARLSVLKGLYGETVTMVPKEEGKFTGIQNNSEDVFNSVSSANESCGNGNKTGKTLINDIFCACIGEGVELTEGPCHDDVMSPKRRVKHFKHCCRDDCCKNNCNQECCKNGCQGACCQNGKCCSCSNDCAKWTQMKYYASATPPYPLAQGIENIEIQCKKNLDGKKQTEKMSALLKEYVELIGKGTTDQNKKIFGHSGRKNKSEVTTCDGSGGSHVDSNVYERENEKICVDYSNNFKDGQYDIPWHKKFTEAAEKMDEAKKIEERILKNRAGLLLLKSQAWVAYSREKDDETSNLDDMNASGGKDTMTEKKSETREYIDVSEETTQPSQPSQPAPSNADGRQYTYISSTEPTQEEAQAAPAGEGGPKYIYVSSTETPSQQTPPPETPTQTQGDPPTQSAKRLREENKTGE